MSTPVEVRAVDDEGIWLSTGEDRPLDVLFEGRRVVSFWLTRDTSPVTDGDGVRFRWPDALRRFLDGTTGLAVIDHVSGDELWAGEVRLGSGEGEIRIEDPQGNPLGLDKSLRLTRLFESRSEEQVKPLLDSMEKVLDGLEEAQVGPFIAYGTLLGAVRGGALIGHDSDADLGYVSRFDHPVDVIRESFALQRRLRDLGFSITRYSGLAFKVTVREADGSPRGLDVFGGFLRDGHLYLMGEVGHPFERDWIEPRSTVTLEGREFPAPARPDKLLEAMYGPSWQVPDPAYQFTTPRATVRRLNGWFRGTRVGLDGRWAELKRQSGPAAVREPSELARWLHEEATDARLVVDIGCGDGVDTAWLAQQGTPAVGLDYFPRGWRRSARRAERRGWPARFEWANLSELRSVLASGAWLAREPGPRYVLARHVADATDAAGRDHLLRLARMLTRDTGALFLEVQTRASPASRTLGVSPLDLDSLLGRVAESGGVVRERRDLPGPTDEPGSAPTTSRMVITWHR